MSRKPSFANLRTRAPVATAPDPVLASEPSLDPGPDPVAVRGAEQGASARAASRAGRKQIAGFFTPEMSLSMHMLARRQGRSLQALMAEAFDDVLRKHGESPLGG